jgi:hypothetical protein
MDAVEKFCKEEVDLTKRPNKKSMRSILEDSTKFMEHEKDLQWELDYETGIDVMKANGSY